MRGKQTGFTLYELMTAVMIIGILVAIALPNFRQAQVRANTASVKANAKAAAVMVQTYWVDQGQKYPDDVTVLWTSASASNYWKTLTNPYDKGNLALINTSTPVIPGAVAYEPAGVNRSIYYIYGYDDRGNHIKYQSRDWVLTNS